MHCLIFTGGDFPAKKSNVEHFFSHIDYIIAADSGLSVCKSFELTPHCIVGDFDSVDTGLLKKYSENIIQTFNTEKDFSDTELAFFEAKKYGATWITLIGGGGGRIDHLFALVELFSKSFYPNVWLTEHEAIIFLNSAKILLLDNLCPTDTISIFPIQRELSICDFKISSQGLFWELSDLKWTKGFFSLSNKIATKFFEKKKSIQLKIEKGYFLIIVPHKTKIQFMKKNLL
ncbi:MAG: thiamine diphosphokinase [Treponemataceae bacterium]